MGVMKRFYGKVNKLEYERNVRCVDGITLEKRIYGKNIGTAPKEILEMVKKATEGYLNSERYKKRKALSRPGDPELFD